MFTMTEASADAAFQRLDELPVKILTTPIQVPLDEDAARMLASKPPGFLESILKQLEK
jgi:hypothetical protein